MELKPCPFCGGTPSIYGNMDSTINYVLCDDCAAATFDQVQSKEQAAAEWNRRTSEAQIIKLQDAIRALHLQVAFIRFRKGPDDGWYVYDKYSQAVEYVSDEVAETLREVINKL